MWKAAFTGRSEKGGSKSEAGRSEAGSVSGERRKKSSRSTRGDNESVISSSVRRDDDRDRDRKRASKYEHGSMASASVYATPPSSVYGTAPSSRVGDGYSQARPLTESALRMLPNDDDDEWEDDEDRKSRKSSSKKKRGSSDEREKRRKSSGKEKERRRSSSRERREKKRSSTSEKDKDRNSRRSEPELVTDSSRAIPEMGSFEQFPGQYAGGIMGGQPEYTMSGALPSSAPNSQFPGQDPAGHGEPMPHPGLNRAESWGHAAEYYLDQGESVHFQPGVRANTPNMLVNPDHHLVTASAEAHPVADTGHGAAADFYGGEVSPVSFSTPQPSKPLRPSKQSASAPSSATKPKPKPSRTSSAGKVAAAGLATAAGVSALGKISSSHQHSQSEQQTSSTFRPQSMNSDYPPTIKPSSGRPNRHNSDGSTYYAAPSQATNPYGSTSQAGMNGIYETSANMNASGSYSQTAATSAYGGNSANIGTTGTYSGKQSTNSNAPLYAAAGVGAAAAGYAAYQHQHNRHDSNTANFGSGDFGQGPPRSPQPPGYAGGGYYGPPGGDGGMMQQHHFHEHKGPMTRLKDGLLNMIASPEDTAKMEMYTEYIGVCKHCFDPRTSAWDAPRVHHYHKRKDSFESLRRRMPRDGLGRKRSSERIDKDSRYYASESSKRRRDERSSGIGMMGAGLAAAGAATAAGALFNDRKNFDDTYSVKSGHRESSAIRRRSRSSSREQRRRSTHGVLRPEGEYVTVRKKDGTVEKRRVVRSRSRSRSATRKSSGGFGLGTAAAAGAALGAAGLAAHSSRRSRSSSRERRRRSSGYSPSRYDRPGSPKDQGGIFGSFFSPPSKQRRGSHEKKKRGFFTFSNGSSSSSNSEMAFGEGYLSRKGSKASLGRKSSTRSSRGRAGRRKSDDHLAATVAGIGATAAALAAAQKGHRISKRVSRPELGARRQVRTHVPGHQHGSPGSSEEDWEDELPSDVDDESSLDGGLAFGDYGGRRLSSRQSLESVASSNDGGLGAWGWRWGGKDKKGRKIRRSSSPQSWQPAGSQGSLSGPIAAGLAAGAAGMAYDSSKPVRPQQKLYTDDSGRPLPTADTRSSTSGSSQSLQYVDPRPIGSEAGTPRHSMPGAFDAEPPIYRPAQGPIAQPQPMTPTKPAFTQPGAEFGYTATTSPEDSRPGMSRRTQSSPVQSTWVKDAAAIGGGALAAGAIIAGASALNGSALSGSSSRRSKDPNSRVSFGLTSEQQRKEDRERRKEEQRTADDERRRIDRSRAVKEEAERAARESRQEEIRQQREDENRRAAESKLARQREEEAELARQEAERQRQESERQRQIAEEKSRHDRERQWEIERLEKEARDRALAAEAARQEVEKQRKAREEAERVQLEFERQRRDREESYAKEQARIADEARRQDEERKQWEAERYAREWQSASRQGYEPEQKRSSTSSWAAPLAGAAAAATVGAVIAGREHDKRRDSSDSPKSRRRNRRSETEDEIERAAKEKYGQRSNVELRDGYAAAEIKPMNEHSGEPLMDDDIYDPDYFKRKQQAPAETRREELARKAAAKVVAGRERSTSPYFEHDTYADFFRPAGLGSKADVKETNPHPDADVTVYHTRDDAAHDYFPQDLAWPKGPHFDEYVTKGTRARSKSAPFGVPRLEVLAPTPPPEEQEKRRRKPGPLPPSSLSRDTDADEEGSTSTKSSGKSERSRSISWGEDKYHTYDVQTPDSHHERESYITSPDVHGNVKDVAKVAGVAAAASVAGKALHEVIVEEPNGKKSRNYTYDDNDFGKDTYSIAKPTDEEEGVEDIEREPEVETPFSRAGLGGTPFYQQPSYDSVSDVGSRFQMPSPGTDGAPTTRGFVEEIEVNDSTPAEERMPGTWDEEEVDIYRPAPKPKNGTDAVSGAERDVQPVIEEAAWEPKLSKKELKKREKAAKRSSGIDSFYSEIPTPAELERVQTLDEEVVGSPGGVEGEYFPPPSTSKKDKKKKKKSGTGLSFADLVGEVAGEPETPAELERVQTLEDSAASTPKEEPAEEYFAPLSKKEKKKREKEAKKNGFADIVSEASGPKDDKLTFEAEEPKDGRSKNSGFSFADVTDGILAAGGVAAAATAMNGSNDSASESPSGMSSKKDKKKKRKSKLGESSYDDPRDFKSEVEDLDTTKPPLSGATEKEPTGMPGGWESPESPSRKASVDEQAASGAVENSQQETRDEPASAVIQEPSTEVDPWDWSAPASKKNKKKSKRASLANQPEVSSPLRSEVAWEDYNTTKVTAEPESYTNGYGFPSVSRDAKSDASRSEPVTVIDTSKPPLSQGWDEAKQQANTSASRSPEEKREKETFSSRSPEEKRESRREADLFDIERKNSGSQKSTSPDDARSVASESAADRRKSRREESRRGSDYASGYDQPDYAYETQSVAASEPAYPGEEEKRRKRRSKHEDDDDDTRSVTSSRSRRDKDERRRSKYDDDDTASVVSSRSRREKDESPSVKKEKKGLFGGLFGRNKSLDGSSSSGKDKDKDGAPLSRSSTRDSKDRDEEDDDRRRRKKKHRDSEYGSDDDTRSVKSESHRRHRSTGERDDDKDSRERRRRSTHDDSYGDRHESRSAVSESSHRHHRRRRTDEDGESLSRTDSRGAVSESGHRHHSRRSTGDELGRDSRDQSFLGNRVEELPPLPASRPVSPVSAVERKEGRPLEAESGHGSKVKDALLVGGAIAGASLLADAINSKSLENKAGKHDGDRADALARSVEHDDRYNKAHEDAVKGVTEPETPSKNTDFDVGHADLSAERPASLARPVSSTAVPLRFPFGHAPTTPGSSERPSAKERAKSFSSPSTTVLPGTAGTPTTPTSAKTRQGRPQSSEFKGVMPLYLVERNRQTPEVEEGLPSLPSSKPSSRASSVHGSNDNYQSAAEEWDSPTASHRSLPALDLAGIGAATYQSEDETTPKATHFPQSAIPWASTTPTAASGEKREKQQPQFFTWEDYVQDERLHEQQQEDAQRQEPSGISTSTDQGPSSSSDRNRSKSPSKAKALAAAAMLGTAAVYGMHRLENSSPEREEPARDQTYDLGPVGPKYEYPLPAPMENTSVTEKEKTPSLSRKSSSKKKGKKSKKQIQEDEPPVEQAKPELERQDTEAFFDAEAHAEEGVYSKERGQPPATEASTAPPPKNALDRFLSEEQHAEEGESVVFASAAAHTMPAITLQEPSPDQVREEQFVKGDPTTDADPFLREESQMEDGGYFASAAAHTMPVYQRLDSGDRFFDTESARDIGAGEKDESAAPVLQEAERTSAEDERPATAYKIPDAKSEPAPLVIDERTVVAAPGSTAEVAPAPQLTRKQSKKAKKKQRASTIFEEEPQTAVEDSVEEASGAQTPITDAENAKDISSAEQVSFGLPNFSQIAHDTTWADSQAQAFQSSMDQAANKPRLGSVHDADDQSLHDVQVDDVHSPVEGRIPPATSVPSPWTVQPADPEADEWATSSSSSKKKSKKDKKKKPVPSWSEEPSEEKPAAESAGVSATDLAIGAATGVAATAVIGDWATSSSSKKAKKDKKKKPPTWSEPEGESAEQSRDDGVEQDGANSVGRQVDTVQDDTETSNGPATEAPRELDVQSAKPEMVEPVNAALGESETPAAEPEVSAADDFFPIVSKKKGKKSKKSQASRDEVETTQEIEQPSVQDVPTSEINVERDASVEAPRELVDELPDVHTPVAEIVQPEESAAQSSLEEFAPASSMKKSKKDKKKAKAAAWDDTVVEEALTSKDPVEPSPQDDLTKPVPTELEAETETKALDSGHVPETTTASTAETNEAESEFTISRKKSKKDKKKKKAFDWDESEPVSGTATPNPETIDDAKPEVPAEADSEKIEAAPEPSALTEQRDIASLAPALGSMEPAVEAQVPEQPSLSRKQSKKDKKKKQSAFAWEPESRDESTPAIEGAYQEPVDESADLVIPTEALNTVLQPVTSDAVQSDIREPSDEQLDKNNDLVVPPQTLNTVLQPVTSEIVGQENSREEGDRETEQNVEDEFKPTLSRKQSKKDKKKKKAAAWEPEPEVEAAQMEPETRDSVTATEEAQVADAELVVPPEALKTVLQPSQETIAPSDQKTEEAVDDGFKPTISRKQSKKDRKKQKAAAWEDEPEPESQTDTALATAAEEPTSSDRDLVVPAEALNTVLQTPTASQESGDMDEPQATEDPSAADIPSDETKPSLTRKQSKKDKKKKRSSVWEPEPSSELESTRDKGFADDLHAEGDNDLVVPPEVLNTVLQSSDTLASSETIDTADDAQQPSLSRKQSKKDKKKKKQQLLWEPEQSTPGEAPTETGAAEPLESEQTDTAVTATIEDHAEEVPLPVETPDESFHDDSFHDAEEFNDTQTADTFHEAAEISTDADFLTHESERGIHKDDVKTSWADEMEDADPLPASRPSYDRQDSNLVDDVFGIADGTGELHATLSNDEAHLGGEETPIPDRGVEFEPERATEDMDAFGEATTRASADWTGFSKKKGKKGKKGGKKSEPSTPVSPKPEPFETAKTIDSQAQPEPEPKPSKGSSRSEEVAETIIPAAEAIELAGIDEQAPTPAAEEEFSWAKPSKKKGKKGKKSGTQTPAEEQPVPTDPVSTDPTITDGSAAAPIDHDESQLPAGRSLEAENSLGSATVEPTVPVESEIIPADEVTDNVDEPSLEPVSAALDEPEEFSWAPTSKKSKKAKKGKKAQQSEPETPTAAEEPAVPLELSTPKDETRAFEDIQPGFTTNSDETSVIPEGPSASQDAVAVEQQSSVAADEPDEFVMTTKKGKKGKKSGTQTPQTIEEPVEESTVEPQATIEEPVPPLESSEDRSTAEPEPNVTDEVPSTGKAMDEIQDAETIVPAEDTVDLGESAQDQALQEDFTWASSKKKGKKGKKNREQSVADVSTPAESTPAEPESQVEIPRDIDEKQAASTTQIADAPVAASDRDPIAVETEPADDFSWAPSSKKKKGKKAKKEQVFELETPIAQSQDPMDIAMGEDAMPAAEDQNLDLARESVEQIDKSAPMEAEDIWSLPSSKKKKKGKKGQKSASDTPDEIKPETSEVTVDSIPKDTVPTEDEIPIPTTVPDAPESATAEADDFFGFATKKKKGKKGKKSASGTVTPLIEATDHDIDDSKAGVLEPDAQPRQEYSEVVEEPLEHSKDDAMEVQPIVEEHIKPDADAELEKTSESVGQPEILDQERASSADFGIEHVRENLAETPIAIVEGDEGADDFWAPSTSKKSKKKGKKSKQLTFDELPAASEEVQHDIDIAPDDVGDTAKLSEAAEKPIEEESHDKAVAGANSVIDPSLGALEGDAPGMASQETEDWFAPQAGKKKGKKSKKNRASTIEDFLAADDNAIRDSQELATESVDVPSSKPAEEDSSAMVSQQPTDAENDDAWGAVATGKKGKKSKEAKRASEILSLDPATVSAEREVPIEERNMTGNSALTSEEAPPLSEGAEESIPATAESMELDQDVVDSARAAEAAPEPDALPTTQYEPAEEFAYTAKKGKKDKKKAKKERSSTIDSWTESAEVSEAPANARVSNDTLGLGAAAVAGAIAAAALATGSDDAKAPAEEDDRAGFSTKKSKKDKKKAKKSGTSTPLHVADEEPKASSIAESREGETLEQVQHEPAQGKAAEHEIYATTEQSVPEPSNEQIEASERTTSSPSRNTNQDIDFAATIAAGLADSGFDPDMVINDPTFHRRASPTGQAEADPEEVFSTTTSKRRKGKKVQTEAETPDATSRDTTAPVTEVRTPADNVDDIINKSLGATGFDPELLEKAMASNTTSSAEIDNDQPEISFATSKQRKKGKKSKKESASDTEWWQVSTPQHDESSRQMEPDAENLVQAPANVNGDDQQSEHGWLVQDELDIDAGDKAYREYKKKKRQQRKLKAAAQAGGLSDNPESAMDDTERSTVVSDSEGGLSRATTKDERPAPPLSPVLEKGPAPRSTPSESAAPTTSPNSTKSIVSSVFPGLERIKRRAPSVPSQEDAGQQDRRSSSGSRARALLHTSEVSQHLPVEVPRTPPQEHERRLSDSASKDNGFDHSTIAAGAAAVAAETAIASALEKKSSGATETSRSVPAEEPSWSFAALQDETQPLPESPRLNENKHQPIRDSGYEEGKRASQQTERSSREIPEILHTSSSFDSLRQRRSLEPLRISTPSSPEKEWKLQTPKQRSGPTDKSSLDAPAHARTPSADTPLLPTSKNRTSYLFQSPPDILAEATDQFPILSEVKTPTHTSDHGQPSRPRASSRGSEPSPVFRTTDGAHDRSPFSPTSPRAPLDSIPEEHHHTRKRSKGRNEVGGPDQIKAINRTETPQNIREKERALSPNIWPSVTIPSGSSARSVSNPLSTSDEVYNRLSWPAVDEENDTVNLDRRHTSQSRGVPDPRSPSVMSNRSNVSGAHFKSPQELRSYSRNSNQSNRSSTPSLRRISLSGDLRAASRRGGLSDSGSAVGARASPKTIPFEPPPTPPLNDDEIDGSASRAVDMNDDVFQGYGDAQQQSQVSPTRPPSVRKRQSMHINELESRLDYLVAENRALQEAREAHGAQNGTNGESLQEMLNARDLQLQAKDAEINQIKAMLQPLQEEIQRLAEINNGLTEANRNLVDDTNGRYATLQSEHSQAHEQWQSTARELEHMRSEHGRVTSGMRDIVEAEIASALADKNAEILRLREQLDIAAEQIRALQVQIQSSKTSDFLMQRDEDYFDGACQKLCQHVQQWVLRFSKMSDNRVCRLSTELNDDKIEARLDNAILDGSDVDKLLGDRVRRRDVFMSVVMTMVWEYVFTRYLFGMDREQRQKLKALEKLLSEVGPPRAVAHWRATTLTLLSQRPQFEDQCALDTEAVGNEIFEVLCRLLPPPSASRSQLSTSLQKVLRIAVDLSVEMRTQRAEYIMLPPLQPEYDTNGDLVRKVYFNASLMNERSGFFSSNEELAAEHAVVKVVLFPLVVKKGDDVGEGEEEIVVCPAQVLVQNDNGKGKKVVRVMSGAMEIDDPIRSTRSRQSNRSLVSEAPGSVGF